MAQYNNLNRKLSFSQLKRSIAGIKNGTLVTLNISSNGMMRLIFHINYQFSKIGLSEVTLDRLLGSLLKTDLPFY